MKTFTDWLKNDAEECGVLAPPMDAQMAVNFLADYLLPKGWYCTGPSNAQANTEIVGAILWRYSRRYRREKRKMFRDMYFKR